MKTPQMYDEPRLGTADRRGPQPPRDLFVRDRKRPIALFAAVAFIAALVAGGSVYAWQRIDASDQTSALESAISERNAAQDQVAALTGRLDGLQARLANARADATAFEGRLGKARAELLAMLGPVLDDGKHFGALYAVGATQQPPRLVIDIEQWFTDQEAVDAAIEDGITVDPGINGYYIRNENLRWRTIVIDPAATVSLSTYPYADPSDPTVVSLSRFGELFNSYEGRLLQLSPYWITVEDGKVVAIEEQFIP